MKIKRRKKEDDVRALRRTLRAKLDSNTAALTQSWLDGVAAALEELAMELASEGCARGSESVLAAAGEVGREAAARRVLS